MARLKRVCGILDGDLGRIGYVGRRNLTDKRSVVKSPKRLLLLTLALFRTEFRFRDIFCRVVDLLNQGDVWWGLERDLMINFVSVIELSNGNYLSLRVEPVFTRRHKIFGIPWAMAADRTVCLHFEGGEQGDDQVLTFPDSSEERFREVIDHLMPGYRTLYAESCEMGEYPFMAVPAPSGEYYVRLTGCGERRDDAFLSLLEAVTICGAPEEKNGDLILHVSGICPGNFIGALYVCGVKDEDIILIRFWK